MQKTYTSTINLTNADIADIIRAHFNLDDTSVLAFRVDNHGNHRNEQYKLTGASISTQVEGPIVASSAFKQKPPGAR